MITVENWEETPLWALVPDADEDTGEVYGYFLYFEDGECDRFCACFDCNGDASIRMVNNDKYGYVILDTYTLKTLAKFSKRVRKMFEETWNVY